MTLVDDSSSNASVETSHDNREEASNDHSYHLRSSVRLFVAVLCLAASVTIPFGVQALVKNQERRSFERAFKVLALQAKETFGSNFARMLSATDSLSVAATSHALETNSVWPCVTLRDYGP